MSTTYITSAEMLSPLGIGLDHNFQQIKAGMTGLKEQKSAAARTPIFCAAIAEEQVAAYDNLIQPTEPLTKLEKMVLVTAKRLLAQHNFDPRDPQNIFIFCTTKGNIDLLFESDTMIPKGRILFSDSAQVMAKQLGFTHLPIVVSNACISGVEGILLGRQLIEAGLCQQAMVIAADLVTDFTISGFYSLKAYAKGVCRPFDKDRTGVNLGECCAGVILSKTAASPKDLKIIAGTSSNDANHMTAPSREARGLSQAIQHCLAQAGDEQLPDFISAHGTGTRYNDAMESLAFQQSGLGEVPFFSLKGIFGHTLGAAGLLETVVSAEALRQNTLLPSIGFETAGEDVKYQPATQLAWSPMKRFLKTASGFGGGNACLMVEKSPS